MSICHISRLLRFGLARTCLIFFTVFIAPAGAADRYWAPSVGFTGTWDDPNEWAATSGGATGAGVPVTGDAAFINVTQFISPYTINYTNSDPTVELDALQLEGSGNFFIGSELATALTFNLASGTLSVGTERIGNPASLGLNSGNILFRQTGGTHLTGVGTGASTWSFSLGDGANELAPTYDLSGGTLTVTGNSNIGGSGFFAGTGRGVFIQSGGVHQVTGDLLLLGKSGTSYTLSGLPATQLTTGQTLVGAHSDELFTQLGGTHQTGTLHIGAASSSSSPGVGTYDFQGGSLITNATRVGSASDGVFNQSGGTHSIATDLFMATGSSATYNLTAGVLNVSGNITDGTGSSTLNIDGGTVSAAGGSISVDTLRLGNVAGKTGIHSLNNDGTVSTTDTIVGLGGTGNFLHSDGAHTVAGALEIGVNTGSIGTYGLNTPPSGSPVPTLATGTSRVGISGRGDFTHNAGTHTVTGDLVLGVNTGSLGTYLMRDAPTLMLTSANMIIGDNGTGVFEKDGFVISAGDGTHTVTNTLTLGRGTTGIGTYILGNGTVNTNRIIVGEFGDGTFSQQAGSSGSVTADRLTLAAGVDGLGRYNLGGGTLTTNRTLIGSRGTATFEHTAGTHTVTDQLFIGPFGVSAATGTYNLSGTGFLDVMSSITNRDTLNVSGGILRVFGSPVPGWIAFTNNGTTSISGGTTILGGVLLNNPNATFNLDGGSLAAGSTFNFGEFNFTGGTFSGDYTNNGLTKITGAACSPAPCFGTVINYTGDVVNNGTWNSDPAETRFVNLTNSSTGVMTGVAGDQFTILGDFINNSEQKELWDTGEVILALSGNGTHDIFLASEDRGNNGTGFQDNFAWGELFLESGAALNLLDGNTGNLGTALYISLLTLEDGIGQLSSINSAFNIFYDMGLIGNAFLQGGDFALSGGGFLLAATSSAVPVPAAVWFFGSGLLGLIGISRRKKVS